jgi:8-oxo-dGTP pyrophosphatase MutT (NUDIX family)
VVTDGASLILGHATRSRYWDIPKGLALPGESPAMAAARELNEETGLVVEPDCLVDLGQHRYRPRKDLALFAWHPARLPNPAQLLCRTTFFIGGTELPELDRFGVFSWEEAVALVGKNLARILGGIRHVAAKTRRW